MSMEYLITVFVALVVNLVLWFGVSKRLGLVGGLPTGVAIFFIVMFTAGIGYYGSLMFPGMGSGDKTIYKIVFGMMALFWIGAAVFFRSLQRREQPTDPRKLMTTAQVSLIATAVVGTIVVLFAALALGVRFA